MTPNRESRLSRTKSPIAATRNKALLNKISTATVSRILRHRRLPRRAESMQRLYAETLEQTVSDEDGSSMSDVAASTVDSDGFSESTSVTDSEITSQSADEDDVSDEDVVVPVSGQKRQKALRPSPSRKRTKRSGNICCSFSPVMIILLIHRGRSGSRQRN